MDCDAGCARLDTALSDLFPICCLETDWSAGGRAACGTLSAFKLIAVGNSDDETNLVPQNSINTVFVFVLRGSPRQGNLVFVSCAVLWINPQRRPTASTANCFTFCEQLLLPLQLKMRKELMKTNLHLQCDWESID